MKHLIFTLLVTLVTFFTASAQSYNDKADNIIGEYELVQDGGKVHVAVTKGASGTYDAKIVWLEFPNEPDGSKKLDTKNPDKSQRSQPMVGVTLFKGIGYNAAKKQWDGVKVYDPTRGIRANVTCTLTETNALRLRATILGIGETQTWKRIK